MKVEEKFKWSEGFQFRAPFIAERFSKDALCARGQAEGHDDSTIVVIWFTEKKSKKWLKVLEMLCEARYG